MASKSDSPTIQKTGWPEGEFGTTDWDAVFEHPSNGIIHLIEAANTEQKLLMCARAIVGALFSRKSDEPLRDEYLIAIDTLNEKRQDSTRPEGIIRQSVISLLREVKDDRIKRSNAYIDKMKAQKDGNAATGDDTADDTGKQTRRTADTSAEIPVPPDAPIPSPFCIAMGKMIESRLKALLCLSDNNPVDDKPLPFLVSSAFSHHLQGIVIQHIGPEMEKRNRSIMALVEKQPRDKQENFILDLLEERKQREVAWEKWQVVWALMTRQSELPKKPKEKDRKKKSISNLLDHLPENKKIGALLDRLPALEKKGKGKKKGWKGEMTIEMWQEACRKTEADNARSKQVWAEITQQSKLYQAPTDDDNALLMNLFARTPEAVKKQISAIVQIAGQGGNMARVFSDFQQGKNVDAALLAACYQFPDTLVGADKNVLKEFMRSFPDTMRKERFSLTERYLKDIFKPAR